MNSDLSYSLTLLLAMVSGAVALLATIQSHWRHHDLKLLRSIDKLFKHRLQLQLCVLVSFVSLVLSLWIHLAWGHGSASSEPMSGWLFFEIHPSYPCMFMLQLRARGRGKPVA